MNNENCGIDADHLNDMMMEGDLFFQKVNEFKKYVKTLPQEEQDKIKEESRKYIGQVTRGYAIDKPFLLQKPLE